jgi:flagellar motor protein MotB
MVVKRGSKGEAEKPFWISYADLMTALMVLFLVAMSVAMLAVTNSVSDIAKKNLALEMTAQQVAQQKDELEQRNVQLQTAIRQLEADEAELKKYQKTAEELENDRLKAEREKEISQLLDEVARAALRHSGVRVDKDQATIDFGDHARFERGKYSLTAEQAQLLRAFVPEVLAIASDNLGQKWLKQIVVEGFASPEGDYLYNLNLSMQRSQRVLCVLLAPPNVGERPMTQAQLEQIRDLFLVGGYSFNAAKFNTTTRSYDESRRVELRLDFLGIGEMRPATDTTPAGAFGKCSLDL